MANTKEYTVDMQRLFLEMMLQDAQSYTRVQNIFNPENFDRSLQSSAAFIKEHCDKHNTMPDMKQVTAVTGVKLTPLEEAKDGHFDWFLEEFEGFTRRQELERAILKSADLLEKGDYDPVEKLVKEAVQISLTKDMGTDYFDDPKARLMAIKSSNGQVSTGWPMLDRLLYGGFNRGELQIWAGGSGSGKSLFMQNLAVNWAMQGMNGCYLTLELSEGLCAMRMDSMMTNTSSKEIFKDIDNVEMKVKLAGKKAGHLRIKYMAAQSTVNDIRAYMKELEIQTGSKPDFLCVDYLDLLMPVSAKVSPNDLFVKDKYVSEELRNLAKELDIIFVTASQLNRSAVEEVEFDHSHIAGGLSKINTADNVFGIFTSRAMRERGRYQIQLMKTRSSSGVGQKVDLEFNIETLRITDVGEEGQSDYGRESPSGSKIMDSVKSTTSTVNVADNSDKEDPKIQADVQSSKLKSMLTQIKQK
jgi:KaiC/GvpD/RAD55 family RecA-like ATPase